MAGKCTSISLPVVAGGCQNRRQRQWDGDARMGTKLSDRGKSIHVRGMTWHKWLEYSRASQLGAARKRRLSSLSALTSSTPSLVSVLLWLRSESKIRLDAHPLLAGLVSVVHALQAEQAGEGGRGQFSKRSEGGLTAGAAALACGGCGCQCHGSCDMAWAACANHVSPCPAQPCCSPFPGPALDHIPPPLLQEPQARTASASMAPAPTVDSLLPAQGSQFVYFPTRAV